MDSRDLTNLNEIQSITSEIKKKFSRLLSESMKKVKDIKCTEKEKKERLDHGIQTTKVEIKKNEEEIIHLQNNLEKTKQLLHRDSAELKDTKEENDNLYNQVTEYEETKKNLTRLVGEMESRVRSLKSQRKNEVRNIETAESRLMIEATRYRKALGINISQVCDNMLKIEFFNFNESDFNGYIIMDFKDDAGNVTEVCPCVMSVERINDSLNNSKDFYDFLKKIRNVFYESIKENVCN